MNNFSILALRRIFPGSSLLASLVALVVATSLTAQAADQTSTATTPAGTAQARPQQPGSPAAGEAKQEDRLVSLVLLLSSPRKLSHDAIAHAVGEGVGVKISTDAVVSKPPYHLVNVGSDKFIINDITRPYFEKSADVADEIKNSALSAAVRDHRAWISVDWVGAEQQTDLRKVYQMIGKMVAHLSGKDTLAVYSPDMDQFSLWAPTVRKALESDDPLAVFEPAQPVKASAPTPAGTSTP
jgi:hypothetical protein